jgi:hypothetical protein
MRGDVRQPPWNSYVLWASALPVRRWRCHLPSPLAQIASSIGLDDADEARPLGLGLYDELECRGEVIRDRLARKVVGDGVVGGRNNRRGLPGQGILLTCGYALCCSNCVSDGRRQGQQIRRSPFAPLHF